MIKKDRDSRAVTFLLYMTIFGFVITEVLLNLTPPISRDALIHHLAIPKLWLLHGGFYEIPWADYSYYPMYINLLYLICLYLKNDIAPKFIHLAFGLSTGGLVYIYLKNKYDYNWGLLGVVIFITTPIVIWLSTSAYIDLGMTFFVTASALAFIKWRDSEYNLFKWLCISAFCMGVAIGSKYNALIAWFFINLILMYSYARDTKRQMIALKYGLIFFAISAVVASPWYLKNYFLTQNPFYPLFNSFFQSWHHQPIQEILHSCTIQQTSGVGFFRLREVMYGETFWETLLTPFRMFFQGDDYSYRYFQGVLNPLLIVFTPFLFLDKSNRRDKSFFGFFSAFFIAIAFFTTAKQVRYIVPVLPFLTILAVMGIKNVDGRLKGMVWFSYSRYNNYIILVSRTILFAGIGILLACNLLYLNNRAIIIQPFNYIFKHESRDAFLRRNLEHFAAVEYINNHLPKDAKIFTMFLGRRGYYLERDYKNDPSFGRSTLSGMITSSKTKEHFTEYTRSLGATHIFMRSALVDKYLYDNFSQQEIVRFMTLIRKLWKPVYDYNGYAVWDIRT